MDLVNALLSNYLPYAKGTIIDRAIPNIDGLKPSQRRILYTMMKMGLSSKNESDTSKLTKSTNIVGQTMKLHPHGDASIYATMVRMAVNNESLNVPYVWSKGNFGKVYSKNLQCAAPRYTEACLAPICQMMFEGIDEDAVDMVDSFDGGMKEPTVLPVKFPTILVNPSSGIAVGKSSKIPSFGIFEVCKATIGVISGNITNEAELMEVLGPPEFSTGGYVHASQEDLQDLAKNGRGVITMSGHAITYSNKIEITEIPYDTTVEDIIEDIIEATKNGELKGVADVRDETGLDGFKLVVELKRGFNSQQVLQKLYRITKLRMKMMFSTSVIVGGKCYDFGLLDLIHEWIKFRTECVRRTYCYRKKVGEEKEHLLEVWEKIGVDIKKVASTLSALSEAEGMEMLIKEYNLDNIQAEYVLDAKIKSLSMDNLKKRLEELAKIREDIRGYTDIANNLELRHGIIVAELGEIAKSYGSVPRKTALTAKIEQEDKEEEEPISSEVVTVILTNKGYLKRLTSANDILKYEPDEGDAIAKRWRVPNNGYLLVFTYSGEAKKILVDDIDGSRGATKDRISTLAGLESDSEIMYVDDAGDFSGHINVMFDNGRGKRIEYDLVSGPRSKYISLFEPCPIGKAWVTKEDKFFLITKRRKAAYCDSAVASWGVASGRVALKAGRVTSGDEVWGIMPLNALHNKEAVDVSKYCKGYCVSIGNDPFWPPTAG